MAKRTRVFLLGDQSEETTSELHNLLQCKDDPILTAFFEEAYDSIRTEAGSLPLHVRKKLPKFTNLADLAARHREESLGPAFQHALACTCQLGYFIRQCGLPNHEFPRPENSYLLGLSTGAIPAATISSCSSISNFLPLAAQSVAIAFRLGVVLADVKQRIDPHTTASWTLQLPHHLRPWISAHLSSGTSVSGPPSVLADLRNYGEFAKAHPVQIPVYTPCHAAHLFTATDIDEVLKTTGATRWNDYQSRIPIVSAVTGCLMMSTESTFRSVVAKSLQDMLMSPPRWDLINEGLPRLLLEAAHTNIDLVPIMTTVEGAVRQTLESYSRRHEVASGSAVSPSGFSSVQIESLGNEQFGASSQERRNRSKLAIVGHSGRYPDAKDPAAFWEILRNGVDTVRKVPKQRWDTNTHVSFEGKRNTGEVPWGCFVPDVEGFDARFFTISPKEAPHMDPAQRLSLMTSYEAMENAGIVPGATPSTRVDRIGCYLGTTASDYMESNLSQDVNTFYITGGNRAFIPGRINFSFEFCGPSYGVDTACSSSLAALHLACNGIWQGDCDTAFACGTNMISNPDGHTALDRGFFLSKTGNCKTFDAGADGYCRGEGIVTIVVKRLEDAIADNNPILAVIAGIQTNHSAQSGSITRPHAPAQAMLFERILNSTGTSPDELSYIEMHGTGTQIGDAVEMESVLKVFAPEPTSSKARGPDAPLYLGAAKSCIGHGEAASGLSSVAKVLLMYQNNLIPPHCGIKTKINPNFPLDLEERNVHIATRATPWERSDSRPRKVLVNNFSAAGGITALLLEDAPLRPVTPGSNSPMPSTHMVTVTAKGAEALKGNLRSMLRFLDDAEASLVDEAFISHLAYTTTARRHHFPHRVMARGSNIREIRAGLETAIAAGQGMTRCKAKSKVLFVFTGQGSHYLGMGAQLYHSFSHFRRDVDRYDQIAQGQGFPSFRHILTAQSRKSYGEHDDALSPQVIQLAMSCLQMALARLWKSWGIEPGAVLGHSLGEYAALNVAGVLSDADTIYLVGMRAGLLQQCKAGTHAMLAVKTSVARAREILSDNTQGDLPVSRIQVSCINGPEDTVLGGSSDQVIAWQRILNSHGIRSRVLNTPYAFHTSQVSSILGDLEALANQVTYHRSTMAIVSPLLGSVVPKGDSDCKLNAKYLTRHCRETVDTYAGLLAAEKARLVDPQSCILEIGPDPVVLDMVKATLGTSLKTLPLLQKGKDTWDLLTNAISVLYTAGHNLLWQTYFDDFKSSHKLLQLPAYSWDLKAHWLQYENDWSVTKPGVRTVQHSGAANSASPPPEAVMPTVECTTIHGIVEERVESADKVFITLKTDISREDISGIARGHVVAGIPLATPSVYAEIGLSLGTYLIERYKPTLKGSIIDVADLVVERALIPHGNGPQILHTLVEVDWTTRSARLVFRSKDGKPTIEHGKCSIRFTDRKKMETLRPLVDNYTSRIDSLHKMAEKGAALRLSGSYAYRLVRSLASFDSNYRAIDEIILDSTALESCSKVSFGQVKSHGKFNTHPAYIDVMAQIAGFVMNGKETTDLESEVYVNHGWRSLQLYEELSQSKSYWSYVKMSQDTSSNEGFWRGNCIMLDDKHNIVAFFEHITLRRVETRIFHRVLEASYPSRVKSAKPGTVGPETRAARNPPVKPTVQVSPAKAVPTSEKTNVNAVKPGHATIVTIPVGAESPPVEVVRAPPNKPSKIGPALIIIAEETGLALADLTDETNFAEIGVDSLISMVIASRFREELDLDLDLEFSLFLDLPTVHDLRKFLHCEDNEHATQVEAMKQVSHVPVTKTESHATRAHINDDITATQQAIKNHDVINITTIEVDSDSGDQHYEEEATKLVPALAIIAEESGLAIEDLTDDTEFSVIGIDSLLSMVIASRFREELDLDLDLEFSLFLDLPTVGDLRRFLTPSSATSSSPSLSSTEGTPGEHSMSSGAASTTRESEFRIEKIPAPQRTAYCRSSSSVILQGLPEQAERTLFLFPDGGGSSSSYEPLPRFNESNTAIIGLNCPYARDPENLKCGIDDLTDSYVAELRRRQPHGPYHLGGWSSGGIFAFLATQRLTAAGEDVASLLIIDSPVPKIMHRLPTKFYEYCDKLGLLGYAMGTSRTVRDEGRPRVPDWLFAHFKASVDMLQRAVVVPLSPATKMPQVSIIWAGDAVVKEQDLDRLPEVTGLAPGQSPGGHFLLVPRKDFGPNGWDEMLPGASITIETVHGANHFSMMRKPHVDQVGRFLERGLQRF
ncbi:Noranthrone synthase [Purpureocillium takamizusanense]|uniref:Noranthrone synthase n=1 Tax=Purpureocillium takamizusanense TaxID=2060973 RepID=A0A9Q8QRX3_9HYPO|nr:Noranthrone synthase [Purpureocillium takamizusanense]UNI24282.1 Noranthrone synthase [Purpureocillium takamizusanense]